MRTFLISGIFLFFAQFANADLKDLFTGLSSPSKMDQKRIDVCKQALAEGLVKGLDQRISDISKFAEMYEADLKINLHNQQCRKLDDRNIAPDIDSPKPNLFGDYAKTDLRLDPGCNARVMLACLNKRVSLRTEAYNAANKRSNMELKDQFYSEDNPLPYIYPSRNFKTISTVKEKFAFEELNNACIYEEDSQKRAAFCAERDKLRQRNSGSASGKILREPGKR